MAETQLKRQRGEESHGQENLDFYEDSVSNSNLKRHKTSSYEDILSLLDDEEEENDPNQDLYTENKQNPDLSVIFTTLQNELSSSTSDRTTTFDVEAPPCPVTGDAAPTGSGEFSGGDDIIKHLLEASDDELGLPNRPDDEINSAQNDDLSAFAADGLWEIEDEAANYYTMLQSELFM